MLGSARTAMKFFVYGLILGLLFAPRAGAETRKEVMGWVSETVQDTVKNVTGNTSAGSGEGGDTQPMSGNA
ncbi:MAG: YtxH domain-containing protein [Chloroflexota bacterium]|nr:YtxH domain-containing protein [Chloroflexia bacterium]MDQ3444537.1 YtxH domain-containing protein [Chloroflexota bacterium]